MQQNPNQDVIVIATDDPELKLVLECADSGIRVIGIGDGFPPKGLFDGITLLGIHKPDWTALLGNRGVSRVEKKERQIRMKVFNTHHKALLKKRK